MLRTHNKRGYSLHLPLAEAAPVAAQRTARTGRGRMLVLLALAALALAAGLVAMTFRPQQSQAVDTPVIAIFPFEPQDADPQWTRLATALTRDVIADLAQSRWLRVLGDATTRPEGPGTRDSAQSLGADFFVTGALQEEAGTMRISAALVETQSGRQVWSRNIEGPADDFLALQRQASEALAGELAASWTGPITEAGRFEARRRGIDNLDAYALFLLAGEAIGDYSPEALAEATRLLEQVVVIAPEFGEAWAKLSQVTYSSVTPDMTEAQMMALWDRAAAAALEGYRVAPQDPHAVAQAANAIRWNDPVEAERLIRRAAELEPNNADMLAFLAFRAVHYPALAPLALEWMERAMMLNPRYPPYYDWNRGFVLVMLGRYREAADALALAPDHAEAQAGRVAALALAGDESGAEAELVDLLADYPDLTAVWLTSAAGLAEPAAESFERGLRLAGAPG